ncbi:hypothetical protein BDQ12DRAFT_674483 [Crucibulum laeve]|uniref:Peptidase S54 rhomboid domain-containing protein n=1 Tax=Crucibulum laeve TaxID=68775 RepID=A0A5C3MD86_9AGAR|nr:hypothetical protein BDQ12DRAFT_674483 [Crucibulum laeve]
MANIFKRVFSTAISNSLRTRSLQTSCLSSTLPNTIRFFSSTRLPTQSPILQLTRHKPWSLSFFTPPSQRTFFTSARSSLRYHPPPTPPPRKPFMGFLDSIPQNTVFYGILAINGIVFFMWYMANQKLKVERDASALNWMYQNFTNSWHTLQSGRIWTLVTACFSHQSVSHILFNGFTFFFMAQPVLQMLGSRQFILLYLGAGILSSMTSLMYARFVDHTDRNSLGASGAIYSIVSLLACVAPTMTFQLYGIIPVPAWLAVIGLFSYDAYTTLADKRGTTDAVGHVGGILTGIAFFFARRFGRF